MQVVQRELRVDGQELLGSDDGVHSLAAREAVLQRVGAGRKHVREQVREEQLAEAAPGFRRPKRLLEPLQVVRALEHALRALLDAGELLRRAAWRTARRCAAWRAACRRDPRACGRPSRRVAEPAVEPRLDSPSVPSRLREPPAELVARNRASTTPPTASRRRRAGESRIRPWPTNGREGVGRSREDGSAATVAAGMARKDRVPNPPSRACRRRSGDIRPPTRRPRSATGACCCSSVLGALVGPRRSRPESFRLGPRRRRRAGRPRGRRLHAPELSGAEGRPSPGADTRRSAPSGTRSRRRAARTTSGRRSGTSIRRPSSLVQTLHNLEHGGIVVHYGKDVPRARSTRSASGISTTRTRCSSRRCRR